MSYCRKALARITCDHCSTWEKQMANKLEHIDKRISQYHVMETIGESGIERIHFEKDILQCSNNFSAMMNTVAEFAQKCMEWKTEDDFMEQIVAQQDMLQPWKRCLYYSMEEENTLEQLESIVDDQKLLSWDLKALFLDLSLEHTKHRKLLDKVSTGDNKYFGDDCHSKGNEDRNLMEALLYSEKETQHMLRNMQQQLKSNSATPISDDDLDASFSKVIQLATQIENGRLSLESIDNDEIQSFCSELEHIVDRESNHQILKHLWHLCTRAKHSIDDIYRLYEERLKSIMSLQDYRIPGLANHYLNTDTNVSSSEQLNPERTRDWGIEMLPMTMMKDDQPHFCCNKKSSASGHHLLQDVVETLVERDLAVNSVKARQFEHDMLNDLVSKEYSLKEMHEQMELLQRHWTQEISHYIESASKQQNDVMQLLPNIRNLLDVCKFQPGLSIAPTMTKYGNSCSDPKHSL